MIDFLLGKPVLLSFFGRRQDVGVPLLISGSTSNQALPFLPVVLLPNDLVLCHHLVSKKSKQSEMVVFSPILSYYPYSS